MTVAKKAPSPDLIDKLLAGCQNPEDPIGIHGLLKQLTKAVVERALQAEMAAHLGHDKHEPVANAVGNTRNGTSRKTIKEVSPSLISSVTDAVIEEVKAWQSRPLDALYPIVYLDCIHVKVSPSSTPNLSMISTRKPSIHGSICIARACLPPRSSAQKARSSSAISTRR